MNEAEVGDVVVAFERLLEWPHSQLLPGISL